MTLYLYVACSPITRLFIFLVFQNLIFRLRINIGQICQEIFDNGFKNYEIRSNEIKEFETAVKDAKQESDHQTRRYFHLFIKFYWTLYLN